jgi:hypothetical protein
MCAALVGSSLPAGAIVPAAAFAQEQEDDDENIASSIVSEVLDTGGSGADDESSQDAANTATEDSNQEQDVNEDNVGEFGDDAADLDDTNVAVPIAIPIGIDVIEETAITPAPTEEEEPPEDLLFCFLDFLDIDPILCFDTLQECQEAQLVVGGGRSQCFGSETFPLGSRDCVVLRDATGQPIDVTCNLR